ncbi:MFS transporter [Actinoplanes italicus]|nr:MFS transporter [Actinoplanes italicus]
MTGCYHRRTGMVGGMWARRRLEWSAALVATALGVVYLLLPPMGSDLAAQVARAGFLEAHGTVPVDLRWYAGVEQFGYSLVSPAVMALLGVRITGVLTLVAGPVLLAVLLRRTGAVRPVAGALLGVAAFAGNLISGRVTYGLGICFGLAALIALTLPNRRTRVAAAVLLALLCAATSPVAGLFLGLAGVALTLSTPPAGSHRCLTAPGTAVRHRRGAGLLVAVPAAVPLAVTSLLFGDGGWMNISRTDTVHAVVTGVVVAVLVPVRAVRIGALLSSAGVLAASLIHTPVGLNATRLAVMFALPVLAAWAVLPRRRSTPSWAVVVLLAVVAWWQPPVVANDIRDIGNPSADPAYFRPLLDRLAAETLTGRVEIPPTRSYWEAASMAEIPLARGWLRQADIDRNPLFFTTVPGAAGTGVELNADSYRAWLDHEAVQFVAVPDVELAWPGRDEAALVTGGLPYLTLIWTGPHWRLYAVAAPRAIVGAPATLVRQDAATIVLDAPAAGEIAVRVRHHRWLTVSGGATVTAAEGDWTRLRVPAAGRYTLTSSLF